MIRILIVDDAETPEFIEGLAREIENGFRSEVDPQHVNPASLLPIDGGDVAPLLEAVRARAAEFWDIALIDINLHDVDMPEADRIGLALSITEAFREKNHSAVVMLYSGTLSKHIPKLIAEDKTAQKTDSERVLARIFEAGIARFVPRDEIDQQAYSALEDPPWLLCVDRLLMKHSTEVVDVEESEFRGKSFAELAAAVRCQDALGQRLSNLVAQFGVASLATLNI